MKLTRRVALVSVAAVLLASCQPPARALLLEVALGAREAFSARLRAFAQANRFKFDGGRDERGAYSFSLDRDDARISVASVWLDTNQEGQQARPSPTQFEVFFYTIGQDWETQAVDALVADFAAAVLSVPGVRKLPTPEPDTPGKPQQ